ncbi:MAG TPA: hypothetical protein VGV64_07240 [Thermoplasmata archaeon]|nr:hypothetical protein [Thermoplasmata archaeon]
MGGAEAGPTDPWVSASDLAEYAFCPRAQWYRRHPPREAPSEAATRSARSGERYHAASLGREVDREARGSGGALLAILVGLATLALLGVVVVLGFLG